MRINNFLLLAVTATVQLSSLPFTSATKMCTKGNDRYGCGAGYQEDGYFTEPSGDGCICCCRHEDGGGFHESTCDGIKSNAKGCGSCMGNRACYEAANSKIGDNSCVGDKSCYGLKDSYIKKTLAALITLAKKWKGPVSAVIVVESVAITLKLATACGTLPSEITRVKKNQLQCRSSRRLQFVY